MAKQNIVNLQKIKDILKPGDVINTSGKADWYNIPLQIAYKSIRLAQKKIGFPIWDDTHTMLYVGNDNLKKMSAHYLKIQENLKKIPDASTFSVEAPKCIFNRPEGWGRARVAVYRYNLKPFDEWDIQKMIEGSINMLLSTYDYGQLVNIAINQIKGTEYDQKTKFFDLSSKRHVCSVGVAMLFKYWKDQYEKKISREWPRLFSTLNPQAKWNDKNFYKDFYDKEKRKDMAGKWSLETTYPAMYANSLTHFNGEFTKVLEIEI